MMSDDIIRTCDAYCIRSEVCKKYSSGIYLSSFIRLVHVRFSTSLVRVTRSSRCIFSLKYLLQWRSFSIYVCIQYIYSRCIRTRTEMFAWTPSQKIGYICGLCRISSELFGKERNTDANQVKIHGKWNIQSGLQSFPFNAYIREMRKNSVSVS